MTIGYQADGSVQISSKGRVIRLGDSVRIGDYTVPGAGEYDIATIQCEAHALPTGMAYFLHTEELTITYISNLMSEVTSLDGASATSILVADVRSDATVGQFKPILKGLEPSYVFVTGAGATADFQKELNLSPYESSTLKVTRAALPLEGTFLVAA